MLGSYFKCGRLLEEALRRFPDYDGGIPHMFQGAFYIAAVRK